jgi:tetratricopeptide (TPR) repeat protein
MNTWIVLPVAIAAAAATAFTITVVTREPAAAPPLVVSAPEPEWSAKLGALAAQNDRLERELASLRAAIDSRAPVQASLSEAELDEAVARYFAGVRDGAPHATEASSSAPATKARFANAKAALDALLAAGSYAEAQALWKEVREAGFLDEVVADYEARAAADPKNPERQHELGMAYLQKIFAAGQGPEAGVWATKADRAFDAALALDSNHWDARFYKATSLSFWPPIFGKQAEAVRQFEILVEQQASSPSEPRFAQTHLWLGNLYEQTGQMEKAKSAWERGLALFPGDEELAKKLEALSNH